MPVVRINAEKDARCTQSVVQLQGDTRTTMVRFIVNRYDGGVDLAGLVWLIKTTNAAGVPDAWEPEMVENAGEKIVIDWLIQGSVNDADGLTEYELNGLGYEADGKAIKWVGGKGTVSVRKSYHPTFGDDTDGFSNLEKLIIYVNGELQDTVAAVERAEAAATAAAEAAADSIWTSKPQGLSFGQQLQAQENIGLLEVVKNLTNPVEAEGNPVRAELVGGLPFDKVVTKLEPVQAGSGDPYPAGCGPNLLPYVAETTMNGATLKTLEDGGVHISGTPSANTLFNIDCNIALDGSYVFSMGNAEAIGDHLQMRLLDASGSMGNTNFNAASADAYTIVAASKTITQFVIRLGSGVAYDTTIYPQLIAGTEKQEFHPYENIRPISGWTGAEMVHAGANLLNPTHAGGTMATNVTVTKSSDGYYVMNGTAVAAAVVVLGTITLPAGTYTLSHHIAGGTTTAATGDAILQFVDKGLNKILAYTTPTKPSVTYTLTEETEINIRLHTNKNLTHSNLTIAAQVEAGTVATNYEPYQGDTFSADFVQTIYGGELNWKTGVLTGTKGYKAFDGTEGWYVYSSAYPQLFALEVADLGAYAGTQPVHVDCSHYPFDSGSLAGGETGCRFNTADTEGVVATRFYISDARFTDIADFTAYLADQAAAGTPVQVAYKLATPTTIQLTPNELAQLEGANTLYGDTIIAITGRQRPDLALVSRIEALESAVLNA